MAQTRPGNAARGWNDPPEFMHDPQASGSAAGQRSSLLTKRVAFPQGPPATAASSDQNVSGADPSGKPPPPLNAPLPGNTQRLFSPSNTMAVPSNQVQQPGDAPINGVVLFPPSPSTEIPKFTAPLIIPTMSPKDHDSPLLAPVTIATNPITNTQVNIDSRRGDGQDDEPELNIPDFDSDEQMFHFVHTRLQKTCVDCSHIVKPRVVEDINRKLEVFSKMWRDGKISYPVKSSMARLATALHRRKCDVAHKIHLSLMMDYVSEVGQWMVGIKRLIQEARHTNPPMSPTNVLSTPQSVSSHETISPESRSGASDCQTQEGALSSEQIAMPSNNSDNNRLGNRETQADGSHGNGGETCSANENTRTETSSGPETTNQNSDTSPHDLGPAIIDTSPIQD